jgi:hypothetical protein
MLSHNRALRLPHIWPTSNFERRTLPHGIFAMSSSCLLRLTTNMAQISAHNDKATTSASSPSTLNQSRIGAARMPTPELLGLP